MRPVKKTDKQKPKKSKSGTHEIIQDELSLFYGFPPIKKNLKTGELSMGP